MSDFIRICAIILNRDREGRIADQSPIPKGKIDPKDSVPYCKFRVSNIPVKAGIFIIKVDEKQKYVGSTNNLNRYFYGKCNQMCTGSPPYNQNWPNECRFKKGIHNEVKTGKLLEVWFSPVTNANERHKIKLKSNNNLRSKWNARW